MMTTTHALVGALVGATTALFAPELTPTAVAVGVVSGALPDADLLGTHRRSLHFPVWGAAAAAGVVVLAAVVATTAAVLWAVSAVAAAVHAAMDALGGSVEHRPWDPSTDRGVYNHAGGYWVRPRRWVRYAGAPEDFGLAAAVAAPVVVLTSGLLQGVLVAIVLVSGVFAAVRRRLTGVTTWLFGEGTPGD